MPQVLVLNLLVVPEIERSYGGSPIIAPLFLEFLRALLLQLWCDHRIRCAHLVRREWRAVMHVCIPQVSLHMLNIQIILFPDAHWLPLVLAVRLMIVNLYLWQSTVHRVDVHFELALILRLELVTRLREVCIFATLETGVAIRFGHCTRDRLSNILNFLLFAIGQRLVNVFFYLKLRVHTTIK